MSWRLGAYERKERASQGQRRDRGPGQTTSREDRRTPCPSRGASGRTGQGHLPARVSGFAHPASKQHEHQESSPDENLPTSQDDTTPSTEAWRTAWSRRPFTLHTHTRPVSRTRTSCTCGCILAASHQTTVVPAVGTWRAHKYLCTSGRHVQWLKLLTPRTASARKGTGQPNPSQASLPAPADVAKAVLVRECSDLKGNI